MASTDVQLRPRASPRSINPDRRHTVVVGLKTSKFRHVAVTSGGKEGTFINLRQVNTRLRIESNGFCINNRWAAVPLSVAGGVIAVFDVHKPGKIADGVIPGLENGANLADFTWYPFDQHTLVAGCDNGMVNFWTIPPDGFYSIQSTPTKSFKAHNDKINIIKFNPVAADVLATAANSGEVIVWDTSSTEPKMRWSCLQASGHSILAMAWSSDGKYLAVVSRDCVLRLYEPRANNIPLLESPVLETPKGARVVFVCNDKFLLISSLTKSSQRTINLYSSKNLALVHSYPLDTSSSLLIPHYDFDSSVVFLTGKGDRTIRMFEVCEESPYFLELSSFAAPNSHQAIAFAAKNAVDVRKVEVARGARLLLSEIENMTFKVPRVKMDFFQNDLYPPALVTWEAVVSAADWFRGVDVNRKFVILKPSGMEPLYRDIFLSDITRYGAVPDSPVPELAKAIKSTNGDAHPMEENGADLQNGNHHTTTNGDGVIECKIDGASAAAKTKPAFAAYRNPLPSYSSIPSSADSPLNVSDLVTPPSIPSQTMKLHPDGLVSRPRADSDSPTNNPQVPKRLSLDPNLGTPLRDLLRRCDEIPGVIAMRNNSDDGNVQASAPEADPEWE